MKGRSALRIQRWHLPLLALLVGVTFLFLDRAYARTTTELTLREAEAAQEIALARILQIGPVAMRDGALFAGSEKLDERAQIVDAVKQATGFGCTLYRGNAIVAETAGAPGEKPFTPGSDAETQLVLTGGTFRGAIEAGGKEWFLVDHPFRDASGHVVGMIATYTDRMAFERGLLTFRLVLGGALTMLTGLLFLLVLRVEQQERAFGEVREAEIATRARLRDEFFASMSHELRTPLSAVLGFAGSLRESAADPANVIEVSSRIEQVSRDLIGIINNILDAAKLESGHAQLFLEDVEVVAVVDRVMRRAEPLVGDKPVRLASDVAKDLRVRADFVKLTQVLTNLVGNAVKFTEKGEVSVRARAEGAFVVIEVADTGIGVAPEHVDAIWEPFRQADGSVGRRYGGTGLGLAIARGLTGLMGGTIQLRSTLGSGSTFVVRIPAAPPATAPAA